MPYPSYEASADPEGGDWHLEWAIRSCAYELWEKAGRPEGVDASGRPLADHFWHTAKAELAKATERRRSVVMSK